MQKWIRICVCCSALLAPVCLAQQWELGGAAGFSFYRNQTIKRNGTEATAGFQRGVSFSAVAGQHPWRHLSGELRYVFIDSDLKLASGTARVESPGEAHLIHYDAIVHATSEASRLRPFLAFGGGVVVYRGTGREVGFQPLERFGVLSSTTELKPLLSLGGGLRVRIANHAALRLELRDYMSPFPRAVVTPAPPATLSGWLHNIVPMIGISSLF